MEKQSKKSRRTKRFYTLKDKNLNDVQIDLNNYRVICNKTGKRKSFYHKYLFNLISRKYEGNIDRFRTEYVSREATPKNERRVRQLTTRIDRLVSQIRQLKAERNELTVE